MLSPSPMWLTLRRASTVLVLQGTELCDWERQQHEAHLISTLQQKEEELRSLRDGPRVTLGEVDVPDDEEPDKEVGLRQPVKEFGACPLYP